MANVASDACWTHAYHPHVYAFEELAQEFALAQDTVIIHITESFFTGSGFFGLLFIRFASMKLWRITSCTMPSFQKAGTHN